MAEEVSLLKSPTKKKSKLSQQVKKIISIKKCCHYTLRRLARASCTLKDKYYHCLVGVATICVSYKCLIFGKQVEVVLFIKQTTIATMQTVQNFRKLKVALSSLNLIFVNFIKICIL